MPILDTVVLFAAADSKDSRHSKAMKYLRANRETYLASFALLEFDIVLKSRGFSADERMELQALLTKDYPQIKVHQLTPQTLYFTAMIERNYQLEYFDAGVAAETLQHDATVISTDKSFEKVKGLKRIW
ncbi:MAG TPA: type II toxin-antitoxin system VapC family toxin [Calditrichaeota bacterium]|nr:type II toxin-antitoxin system VapC family toxin [Calditrichota bacterium]